MKAVLRSFHMKAQFHGSPWGLLLNPFYFARKGLHDNIRALSGELHGRLLDVGCGQKPYRHLFRCDEYVGLEIDTPENRKTKSADAYYDGRTFPFEDSSFDAVVANQVFEHVFNPGEFLGEIRRVLKPDGNLLLTVPFLWDEHEQPFDFARYSSFGLRHILEQNGFAILELKKSVADARVLAQLLNAYLFKSIARPGNLIRLGCAVGLAVPVNILGALLGPLLPSNPDLYLDNIVLARRA